jgi:hypothetical protein
VIEFVPGLGRFYFGFLYCQCITLLNKFAIKSI